MCERTPQILLIKRGRSCNLLCWRSGCCDSTSKTQMRDRIFKLTLIHASVIYQIAWISIPFRENSITLSLYCATLVKKLQWRSLAGLSSRHFLSCWLAMIFITFLSIDLHLKKCVFSLINRHSETIKGLCFLVEGNETHTKKVFLIFQEKWGQSNQASSDQNLHGYYSKMLVRICKTVKLLRTGNDASNPTYSSPAKRHVAFKIDSSRPERRNLIWNHPQGSFRGDQKIVTGFYNGSLWEIISEVYKQMTNWLKNNTAQLYFILGNFSSMPRDVSDIHRCSNRKWGLNHVHCWKSVNVRTIPK